MSALACCAKPCAGRQLPALLAGEQPRWRIVTRTDTSAALPSPLRLCLQNIASISAGNDDAVGEMIADALDKVGSNGVLSIESGNR